MARSYMQGFFSPLNPRKYQGDRNQIIFRSSWERTAFNFCDTEKAIKKWASEEVIIPYTCPLTGKARRYFVDMWIQTIDGKEFLIEIKPYAQTQEPRKGKGPKAEKRYQEEVVEYLTNQAKWKAAREFCAKRNMDFVIWHEGILYPGDKTWEKKK